MVRWNVKTQRASEAEIHGYRLMRLERVQTPSSSEIRWDFANYDTQTEKSVSLICLSQMPLASFIFL